MSWTRVASLTTSTSLSPECWGRLFSKTASHDGLLKKRPDAPGGRAFSNNPLSRPAMNRVSGEPSGAVAGPAEETVNPGATNCRPRPPQFRVKHWACIRSVNSGSRPTGRRIHSEGIDQHCPTSLGRWSGTAANRTTHTPTAPMSDVTP